MFLSGLLGCYGYGYGWFVEYLFLGCVILARDDGDSYIKALTDCCYCTGEDGEE